MLRKAIQKQKFREDLFYRINVMTLLIPPLRERGSDVLQLADAILQRTCHRLKAPTMVFSEEASQSIADYNWPGNVREGSCSSHQHGKRASPKIDSAECR